MRDTESGSRRKTQLTGGNGRHVAETPSPHIKLGRKCTVNQGGRASAASGGASDAILRAHDTVAIDVEPIRRNGEVHTGEIEVRLGKRR